MNSVLIVDDHPVARLAVRMLLEKDGMTVIGETDDGLKAVQQARQLRPDLVIIDIDIPSINGINVVQRLRANDFKGGILVLTGKDDDHYIKRCAGAGADGFISKRNNLTELHYAIRAIKSGYGFFPINRARQNTAGDNQIDDNVNIASLSDKELQVLHFLAKGIKIVDIAGAMMVSDKTVSTYKRRMMKKLDLKTPKDIYDFALRNKID